MYDRMRCVFYLQKWYYKMFYLWFLLSLTPVLSLLVTGSTDQSACVLCVCVCLFLDYFGVMKVQKMKVRVELMVVKGPSVYLVLVNMKYNPSLTVAIVLCYCCGSRSSAHL